MIDEIEFEVEYVDGEWGKLMRMYVPGDNFHPFAFFS